jgi:hypothetical protein
MGGWNRDSRDWFDFRGSMSLSSDFENFAFARIAWHTGVEEEDINAQAIFSSYDTQIRCEVDN